MIANNFSEFTGKLTDAVLATLNHEVGQQLTNDLLNLKLAENPDMTADDWKHCKQEFMVFMFYEALKMYPELSREMASHIYNEINSHE